jgi:hypothetical protein
MAGDGVDLAWYTTRERAYDEVLPWEHLDAGLDRDWLWQDWLAAIDPAGAAEVEDCRWTPCFECGACSSMGTEIQVGPTGARMLPLSVVGTGPDGGSGGPAGAAASGTLAPAGTADPAGAAASGTLAPAAAADPAVAAATGARKNAAGRIVMDQMTGSGT